MPEFAKIYAEVYADRHELKFKHEKRYQSEAFFLYGLICLHRYDATGISNKTIQEVIEIWELDYDNTMRRFKLLRDIGWIEVKRGKIRPLKGFVKTVKATVQKGETVNSTAKTVNSTVETVNSTVTQESSAVNSTVSAVNFTAPSYKECTELVQNPKSSEQNLKPAHTPESLARRVGENSDSPKSKFSYEECFRYAEICKKRGEPIRSAAVADSIFKSGEKDFLIEALLYPEFTSEPADEPIVYEYDAQNNLIPKPLGTKQIADALTHLLELISDDFEIDEFQKYYTPEDWEYLTKELEKLCPDQ